MAKCFNTQQQSLSINGWDRYNAAKSSSSYNHDTITKQPHPQSPSSLSYRTRIGNPNTITNIHIPSSNKFHDDDGNDTIDNHRQQQYWRIDRSNTNNNDGNTFGIAACDDHTSVEQHQFQQQWPSYALCKSTLQSRSLSVPRRRNPMMNMEQVSMMMMMDEQQRPSTMNDRPASSLLFQQQPPSIRGSFRSDGSGQSQTCRPFSQQSFHWNDNVDNHNMIELPALKPIYNYPNHQPFNRSTLSDSNNRLRATFPIMQRNWILSRRPKLEPVPEAIYDYSTIQPLQPPPLELPPRSPRTLTKYKSHYQNLPIPRHLLTETLGPKPNSQSKNKQPVLNSENSSSSSSSSDGKKSTTGYTRDKLLGAVEKVRSGQYLLINRDSPYRHSFEGRGLTQTYHPSSSSQPQTNNHNQVPNNHRTIPHNIKIDETPRPPPRKHRQIVGHSMQQSTMISQYDSPGQSSDLSFEEPQYQHRTSAEENISADENYEFDDHKTEHYHHQRTKSNPVAIPSMPAQRPLQSLTSKYYSYRAPKNMSITDIERRCLALRQEFLHFRQRQAQLKHLQPDRSVPFHKQMYYRPISIINDDEPNIVPSSPSSSSSSSDGFESLC
ncbi:hypothetical protein BLA29_002478 [Euroglyphus maynei]|uniref:Uncharacterized protein n=1 Tax=Euroglyphus maynei TaxID=6958 RepID=A0A1Y3BCI4_EURMA|nr:hypothetical protein BLA29_002478 [Euroglyphus maynei]